MGKRVEAALKCLWRRPGWTVQPRSFLQQTRRGLTNSLPAMHNRKHAMMEREGNTSLFPGHLSWGRRNKWEWRGSYCELREESSKPRRRVGGRKKKGQMKGRDGKQIPNSQQEGVLRETKFLYLHKPYSIKDKEVIKAVWAEDGFPSIQRGSQMGLNHLYTDLTRALICNYSYSNNSDYIVQGGVTTRRLSQL